MLGTGALGDAILCVIVHMSALSKLSKRLLDLRGFQRVAESLRKSFIVSFRESFRFIERV